MDLKKKYMREANKNSLLNLVGWYIIGLYMIGMVYALIPSETHTHAEVSPTVGISNLMNNLIDSINTAIKPSVEEFKMDPIFVSGTYEMAELRSEAQEITVQEIPEEAFSKEDVDLIARVTMSEASIEPYNTQVAVAQTVLNRLHNGGFGDTISEVVYSKWQFSTADNGDPTEQVYQAVYEAIYNPPHPFNMLYFRQYYFHEFADDYKQIGGMYFSLSNE